ncbi:hypothetical protein [Aquaticitalea lipolytica]|uniref:hypothetical protein n=1 Tax=Aquaticitalea lipolytica TaxID=1247562 RepID=UPI0024B97CC4|nr:hypothetical protein [Aquaticitalea lipolytica]
MVSKKFKLTNEQLIELTNKFPNTGKNSHVGKLAVEIAKLYFQEKYINPEFNEKIKGVDLSVLINNKQEDYEIKGTVDSNIAFDKLKVSGKPCYDKLVNGQILLRICDIGKQEVKLHFLKFNEDFTMIPEPRWSVKKV